jgi:hypothetical protein
VEIQDLLHILPTSLFRVMDITGNYMIEIRGSELSYLPTLHFFLYRHEFNIRHVYVCLYASLYTYTHILYKYIHTYIGMYGTYVHDELIFFHALLSVYDGALHDDWVFLIHIQGKYKWHDTCNW